MQAACRGPPRRRGGAALSLRHGPVHAKLRYNDEGAWILEVHARPIGGLCARAIRMADGIPLEETILVHALGGNVWMAEVDGPASGVMMIPIPRQGGIYRGVEGSERALAVADIEDVTITATEGQQLLVPLPEGSSYLGFIFARGETAEAVELALRRSHAELRFHIATALETFPQAFVLGATKSGGNCAPSPKKYLSICSRMNSWACEVPRLSRYSFMSIFMCSTHIFHASLETLS